MCLLISDKRIRARFLVSLHTFSASSSCTPLAVLGAGSSRRTARAAHILQLPRPRMAGPRTSHAPSPVPGQALVDRASTRGWLALPRTHPSREWTPASSHRGRGPPPVRASGAGARRRLFSATGSGIRLYGKTKTCGHTAASSSTSNRKGWKVHSAALQWQCRLEPATMTSHLPQLLGNVPRGPRALRFNEPARRLGRW